MTKILIESPYKPEYPLPFPLPAITEPYRLDGGQNIGLCLNPTWLQVIRGMLWQLTYPEYWTGEDHERSFAVQQVNNIIFNTFLCLLSEDDLMRIRQKNGDPCILEVSYDNGASWSDAFNYALCFNSLNTQGLEDLQITVATHIDNINNIYNGTPESIAPDASDYADVPNNGNRDDALCFAISNWLLLINEDLKARESTFKRYWNKFIDWASYTVGIVGSIASTVIGLWFTSTVYGIPVSAIVTGLGVASTAKLTEFMQNNLTLEPSQLKMTNDTMDAITCHLVQNLAGDSVSFTEYQSALVGNPVVGIDTTINDMIEYLMQDITTYQQFMVFLQASYLSIAEGNDLPCPCGTWSQIFDFTVTDGLFATFVSDLPAQGVWTNGVGWQSTNWATPPTNKQGIRVHRPHGATIITDVSLSYVTTDNRLQAARVIRLLSGSQTIVDLNLSDNTGTFTTAFNGYWSNVDKIQLFLNAGGTGNFPTKITNLALSGRGVNPFI